MTTPSEPNDSKTLTVAAIMHALDGSGFYRFWLPYGYMGEVSHHIVGCPIPNGQPMFQDPRELESIDVLIMQRPAGKHGVRQIEQIAGKTVLIYENDDDLIHPDPWGLPHLVDDRMADSIKRCIRLSDMVTVSTPYLAEEMSKYNENVVVLPNVVDEKLLTALANLRKELDPDRPVKIGWAGGTSHLADLEATQGLVRRVLQANPEAKMAYAGYDYSPTQFAWDGWKPIPGPETTWTPWQQEMSAHYRVVSTFDIGIAPLADTKFNHSKSHLKALEYAAVGIPCVATDLPPYRDFVIDGVTGFLCKTPADMERHLNDLVNDASMRTEMGAKAKEHAANWTIQGNWQLWESAVERAAKGS